MERRWITSWWENESFSNSLLFNSFNLIHFEFNILYYLISTNNRIELFALLFILFEKYFKSFEFHIYFFQISLDQGCQIEISEIRDFLLEIRILSGHFFLKQEENQEFFLKFRKYLSVC